MSRVLAYYYYYYYYAIIQVLFLRDYCYHSTHWHYHTLAR